MKYQRLFTLAGCFFLTALTISAQEKPQTWSLEDCLQYAYQQNIELKQSRLSLESSRIDTKNAKAKLLPSLTAGISYQYPIPRDKQQRPRQLHHHGKQRQRQKPIFGQL